MSQSAPKMRRISQEEIRAVYAQGEDAVITLVEGLLEKIGQLEARQGGLVLGYAAFDTEAIRHAIERMIPTLKGIVENLSEGIIQRFNLISLKSLFGGQYADPGMDYYEQRYQKQALNHLRTKAQSLGFDLVAQSTAT